MDDKTIREAIYFAIEIIDDKVPMIGPILDLPFVDEIEKKAVDTIVDTVLSHTAIDVEMIAGSWSA